MTPTLSKQVATPEERMSEKVQNQFVSISHDDRPCLYFFPDMTKQQVLEYIVKNKFFGTALTDIKFHEPLKEHSGGVVLVGVLDGGEIK